MPALSLSPAYDVVPSGNGATHHDFLISEDSAEPSLSNARSVCAQFDLTDGEAVKVIKLIIAVVDQWQAHFKLHEVTDKDIEELVAFIDSDDLLAERRNFETTTVTVSPLKPRRGPFGSTASR